VPVGSAGTGAAGIASEARIERPFIARMIHTFALPIILFWLVVVVMLSVFVPSLEVVGQQRSVSLSPKDAPSLVALKRIGHLLDEGETDSVRWTATPPTSFGKLGQQAISSRSVPARLS
jgi:RND superfamily putative drug exporter